MGLETNRYASMNQYWMGYYVPTSLQAPKNDLACRRALGSEFVLFFVSRSEMQKKTRYLEMEYIPKCLIKIRNEKLSMLGIGNKG
jgi:hypothetical protein